jgi:hypothetical protein
LKKNASLIEPTVKINKTNFNTISKSFNWKTQKSGKKQIKYTKLYDLTELLERPNIYVCHTSRSSSAQEKHANPQRESINRPKLVNTCIIVMNKRTVDKSSVEPIAPADTTRSKLLIGTKYELY